MRPIYFTSRAALIGLVLSAAALLMFNPIRAKTQGKAAGQAPAGIRKPNLYQLHGDKLQISYSTSSIRGTPTFSYQADHQSLSFHGDEIRTTTTEMGTLVSVTIRKTVDTGSTTFTLLLPRVNLQQPGAPTITTEGIITEHRFSPVPAQKHGQLDTYTVIRLTGSAQSVVF